MPTVCVRIKKEKWGSHDAPCPGFLDLQGANMDTLVRIIMYYNVPNNVDSLLNKRHPDAGENRVRQGCRTRFSAQWTATGIAKCSNEIGFDDFVKPDLAWKIYRKLFGNIVKRFRPQAALGTGVSPASAQNVHWRYACVENQSEMDGFFAWNN